ncbi:minor capsid protein [Acinetobacter johnsonii]|uniref:Minor capsid protein n=1 Tax=Acinetobacter johnsonii TaxID=40214 RepID=A0AAJ6IDC0_ACIJO|nr:minor capsid protein [Acinetobacter johnsonii]ALV73090.1 head morphogenesis protein [Acinetobacter johnsonii XBB1]MDH1532931.1 minor capsid protein [Acinetobacter johnsonii]WMG17626.1 minor capsid protein [Acinetobacter johnsonii]SNU14124.1 phage head morphogenesis protein, SPP1 gp7 family [Acinetobacter johnsonii]
MDKSAQKALIDALSQHQAYLYRASSQSVNELTAQFNKLSNVQLLRLSELLEDLTDSERKALQSVNFSSRAKASRNIEEIKATLSEWFSSLNTELPAIFEQSAIALAVYEAGYTVALMGETLKTDGEKLYQKAKKVPFSGGQLVDYLFSDIAANLRKKVEYVIRDGFSQGQTNQQIIQRIKGKKSLDYKDGILSKTESEIERQVRTARSHISNATYIDTYKALGYEYVKVVATLDGRTCKYCASIDGDVYPIDDPTRPRFPVHPNNRTTYVGCDKDGNIAGLRPFVMDERKVKDIPKDERKHLIGQLDANTSFKEFFEQSDEFFQRTWLGKTKYELYKKGEYSIDKFADPLNKRGYTLAELKALDEKTFNNVLGEK